MKQKLFKILINGKSCHGGKMAWSLPKKVGKKWIPGDWHKEDGKLTICEKGLHLTSKPYNWYKWGCTNYEAEAKGIVLWQEDKCVASEVRLLKEVPHPKWWTDCEGWISTLKNIAWLKPDGKSKEEWLLFENRAAARDAAMDAARDAAMDAARDAAWDAAMDAARDAAWAAARAAAMDAARDAAWAAAWDAAMDAARAAAMDAARAAAMDAARDAAWAAARDAAWDAARDAKLYATAIIAGWNFESKHQTHIKKRMEVWQKGYGLLCDVGGKMYVYKKL